MPLYLASNRSFQLNTIIGWELYITQPTRLLFRVSRKTSSTRRQTKATPDERHSSPQRRTPFPPCVIWQGTYERTAGLFINLQLGSNKHVQLGSITDNSNLVFEKKLRLRFGWRLTVCVWTVCVKKFSFGKPSYSFGKTQEHLSVFTSSFMGLSTQIWLRIVWRFPGVVIALVGDNSEKSTLQFHRKNSSKKKNIGSSVVWLTHYQKPGWLSQEFLSSKLTVCVWIRG